jgi:hypothetical protein
LETCGCKCLGGGHWEGGGCIKRLHRHVHWQYTHEHAAIVRGIRLHRHWQYTNEYAGDQSNHAYTSARHLALSILVQSTEHTHEHPACACNRASTSKRSAQNYVHNHAEAAGQKVLALRPYRPGPLPLRMLICIRVSSPESLPRRLRPRWREETSLAAQEEGTLGKERNPNPNLPPFAHLQQPPSQPEQWVYVWGGSAEKWEGFIEPCLSRSASSGRLGLPNGPGPTATGPGPCS